MGIFCLKSFMGFYAISRYIDDETYVLPRNIVFKLALRGPSYIFKRGVAGIHALHAWLVYEKSLSCKILDFVLLFGKEASFVSSYVLLSDGPVIWQMNELGTKRATHS